jgi:hypothetical protein
MSNVTHFTFENLSNHEFDNMNDARDAINQCAKDAGFAMTTISSSKRDGILDMGCKHYGAPRKSKSDDAEVSSDNKDSRKARSKKWNCQYRVKAHTRTTGMQKKWVVDYVSSQKHNHPFPQNIYYYSENRRLDDDQKKMAASLIDSLAANKVVKRHMKEEANVCMTSKDVSNFRQTTFAHDSKKAMFNMITGLQKLGYHVHYQTIHDNEINTDALNNIFFTHPSAIEKARRFNETISLDATYKTNSNRLPFVNVVGVSNTGFPSLKSFFIAGGWIIDESAQSYNWFIQKLQDTVWPLGNPNRPKIIVSDDETALTSALDLYFPESTKLLCQAHIKRNFRTNTWAKRYG